MLTGACISRAGFNRTTAYSTAVWVLAPEVPDIEVAYYFGGSVTAFAHHRGWTHTFMAAPVNSAFVVGCLYLIWRWRKSRAPEPRWGLLLLYGVLATFGHILLDYVSAYGVRPFEPMSFQWFSWDIVSI